MSGCHDSEPKLLQDLRVMAEDLQLLANKQIELEERIKLIEQTYNEWDYRKEKKLHKCPNCNGMGKIEYYVETAKDNSLLLTCILCSGKGIVFE
jgi:DnaJ-class molecular chaperone